LGAKPGYTPRPDAVHNNAVQLHDCETVFHPETLYILCIMTKGNVLKRQAQVTSSVTRVIYRAVSEKTPSFFIFNGTVY
jgi:hypothetical protein